VRSRWRRRSISRSDIAADRTSLAVSEPPRGGRGKPAYHGAAQELRAGLWHWQAPHPEWSTRAPVIVLTAPWHERDTRELFAHLGTTVFAPPPDTARDLIDKYGITAEQAGDGSPDLRRLRDDPRVRWYGAGDTFVDFGTGFALNERLRGGVIREQVAARLRPLLELPVEVVCPAHGAPVDRAALSRALSL
jgi:hypothetical protein